MYVETFAYSYVKYTREMYKFCECACACTQRTHPHPHTSLQSIFLFVVFWPIFRSALTRLCFQCKIPPTIHEFNPHFCLWVKLWLKSNNGNFWRIYVYLKRCISSPHADLYELPLHECIGPFSKPRPWGIFSCIAPQDEVTVVLLAWSAPFF